MASPIRFYFDFASPYGYLAAHRIDPIGAKHGREVEWRPVMLGAIFKVTQSMPVMHRPLQGDYLRHDVPRFARLMQVSLTWPDSAPIGALAASRAFYWLLDGRPVDAVRLAKAVYHAHWGQGRDMGPAEAVAEVASSIGIEGDALLAAIQEPAVKERLKAETDAAVAAGVFGSPTVLVDGELFWGCDRLDQVERWLETGGW